MYIYLSCHNKIPPIGWLNKQKFSFSILISDCQDDWLLVRTLSLACRWCLLVGSSHGWCGQSSDLGLPDGLPSYLYLSESYVCLIYDAWGFWLYLAGGAGEGNGSPPQCSCLENPRDGGAWWAAVYGVAQSWTRLKRLSSSSSGRGRKYMSISSSQKQNSFLKVFE